MPPIGFSLTRLQGRATAALPSVFAAVVFVVLWWARTAMATEPRSGVSPAPGNATGLGSTAPVAIAADGMPLEEPIEISVRAVRPQPNAAPKARHVAGWVASGARLELAGRQAADVLRESPGVQVSRVGGFGAPATASLRGATAAQTPVYLAGIRLNDEVGGAANLADVPLFLIDRVEVYRSHAPLVGDQMGIGGAIFFEPRRPTGPEAAIGGMSGSYGSRAGWFYVGAGDSAGALLAGAQVSGAANDYAFHDDRGTLYRAADDRPGALQNADFSSHNVWLSARRRLGRAHLNILFNRAEREQGAPTLATVPSREARIDFERSLFGMTASIPFEIGSSCGAIQARTAIITTQTTVDDPLSELGLLTRRTTTPGQRLEQTIGAREQLGSLSFVQQVTASVERLERYRSNDAVSELELSARRSQLRVALGMEYGVTDSVFLEGEGAAYCHATATGDLGLCDEARPTGRLGISLRRRSYELFANVGSYHRVPTLSELYGVSVLVRGNDGLGSELGHNAELGGRWQWLGAGRRRLLWLDASAFGRQTSQLVTFVRTAQGFMHPVNRDRARTLGFEASAGAAPLRWVEGEASASVLDPRDTSPRRETVNDVLPFHSRFVGSARLTLSTALPQVGAERLTFSATGLHQSSRYADPAGLGVIPAQRSVDLEGGAVVLGGSLKASARLVNALGAQCFDVVGFPLPGRSFFFSMEARL